MVTGRPCARCPFRQDVPISLRQDRRVEIAHALMNDGDFPCHETTVDDDDEEGSARRSTSDSLACAGAVKALALAGGTGQTMRIAERLGMVDLDRVESHGADVWDLSDWVLLAEGATGDDPIKEDEEVETCNTVDSNCLAPAGFMGSNGGIVRGTVAADGECPGCGEPVCSECADDEGMCGNCHEDKEDDDDDD
jgi:hypothetical protein